MMVKMAQAHTAVRGRLSNLNWEAAAQRLGLALEDQIAEIPLFGHIHQVSYQSVFDGEDRPAGMALELLLYRYILDYPNARPPIDQRVSFREIDGSGPLVARFADNTHKIIAGHFADKPDALREAARRLAGKLTPPQGGYDLSVRFDALPGLPIYLQYNAEDEDFPAYAGLLFHRSTGCHLGLLALFILGTYLTGRLIQHASL